MPILTRRSVLRGSLAVGAAPDRQYGTDDCGGLVQAGQAIVNRKN
jgi:hypothetical protein